MRCEGADHTTCFESIIHFRPWAFRMLLSLEFTHLKRAAVRDDLCIARPFLLPPEMKDLSNETRGKR